jgi:hypothetical protein
MLEVLCSSGREPEKAAIGEFIAGAVRPGDGLVVLGGPGVVSCRRQPAANREEARHDMAR